MPNQQQLEKEIHEVKAKDLKIVWIDDARYWRKPSADKDDEPAELLQVCWLEVTGSVQVNDPSKKFKVTFEVSLTADAFGWNGTNLFILGMKRNNNREKRVWRRVNLLRARQNPDDRFTIPNEGSLILDQTPAPDEYNKTINFGIYEIWSGKWKGGLKIHKAIVEEVQ